MKLLGFMSKVIKLLLTELVGQCRNILQLIKLPHLEKPIRFYLSNRPLYTGRNRQFTHPGDFGGNAQRGTR